MPKTGKHNFRLNRKAFGLTYSCPKNLDENPIQSHQELIDHYNAISPHGSYIVAKELHKDGKTHWHLDWKFTHIIDTTDPRFFDFKGVHPNICDGAPGKGWKAYITKDFDFESNCFEKSVFEEALTMPTADEAIEVLWRKRPQLMCERAHNIEANIRKRMKSEHPQVRFNGPFLKEFYPTDWDPATHSLLLVGPPGIGKTQFARYLLGDNHYIKGSLDSLKEVSFEKPLLFDEICMLERNAEESKEITDVQNGGGIHLRHKDVQIPPGIPHIFCHNMMFPFRDPHNAVYGRRVHYHEIEVPDPAALNIA